MKNKISLVLFSIAAAIFAVFGLGGFASSSAQAAEVTDVTGNTAADATITDQAGGNVTANPNLMEWQQFEVSYNWSVADGKPVAAGDTMPFTLPSTVKASEDTTVAVKNSDGIVIGSFTIAKGATTGTLTFNENVVGATIDRKGTLSLTASGTKEVTTNPNDFILNKNGWIPNQKALAAQTPTELIWNLAFNSIGASLGDVQITDTLGPNQTYIKGSVVANTGYYLKGQFISTGTISPTSVEVVGNKITFNFSNITTVVNMTYKVNVTGVVPDQVNTWNNGATLTAGKVTQNASSEIKWGANGTGNGNAENGSVILTKTSTAEGSAVLPGATFELLDGQGNVLKTDLKTDNNGQLVINDLAPGQYNLQETAPPEGFQLNNERYAFTIVAGQTAAVTVAVSDKPIPPLPTIPGMGTAILTKTDSATKKLLPGAMYNLFDSEGKIVATQLITDENGSITIPELTVGKYTLVEITAPSGYELDDTPIAFEITADKTTNVIAQDDPQKPIEPPVVTPENPEPEKPGTGEPENPGTGEPENPGTGEPENPGTGEPENPGTGEPENPGTGEPEKPGTTEPEKPSVTEPSKPGTSTSPSKKPDKGKLPQTSNQTNSILAIIGSILLAILIIIKMFFWKQKKN